MLHKAMLILQQYVIVYNKYNYNQIIQYVSE